MSLHLELYVLRSLGELTAGTVTAMTRLDINECMPLNAQLTDLGARRGSGGGWGPPRVKPQPCLRGFRLEQNTHDDHTHTFDVDSCGDSLTWLYASDFDNVVLGGYEGSPAIDFVAHHPDAVAALAYIKALPPDTPIVLYWI